MERSALESNELQFFSLWSRLKVSNRLILLYNPNLPDDVLINHARLNELEETLRYEDLKYVKKFYSRLKIKPTLFLNAKLDSSQKHLLRKEGFRVIDRLITMSAPTLAYPTLQSNLKISACSGDDLAEWIKVFVEAFSTPSWSDELKKIVVKMLKHPSCTLYLARYKGTAIGVAARYSTEGVSGLYCLGTIPKLRNRGVGSALVAQVVSEAHRSGDRTLCLQTLASERLITLYVRLGFRRLYSKAIYSTEDPSNLLSNWFC